MVVAAQIIPVDRPLAPTIQQHLRYQGHHRKALLWKHLYRKGLILLKEMILLKAQLYGNHYNRQRGAMHSLSLFFMDRVSDVSGPISAAIPILFMLLSVISGFPISYLRSKKLKQEVNNN